MRQKSERNHVVVVNHVVEGDLLVVPAKRRSSPSPATPNGGLLRLDPRQQCPPEAEVG
jgi:hypothetical protein